MVHNAHRGRHRPPCGGSPNHAQEPRGAGGAHGAGGTQRMGRFQVAGAFLQLLWWQKTNRLWSVAAGHFIVSNDKRYEKKGSWYNHAKGLALPLPNLLVSTPEDSKYSWHEQPSHGTSTGQRPPDLQSLLGRQVEGHGALLAKKTPTFAENFGCPIHFQPVFKIHLFGFQDLHL